jgi:hypothetical protein
MATALGSAGIDPSFGRCACLRRQLSGEPDAGNLHLRYDEGRAGRANRVAFSPTLPARPEAVVERYRHTRNAPRTSSRDPEVRCLPGASTSPVVVCGAAAWS